MQASDRLDPRGGRRLPRSGKKGEDAIGPSPVDRARPGSKHHVLTDATGIPLAVLLTGGNSHDVTQLMPLLDAVPPIRGRVGRPRRKPRVLVADRGYDFDKYRRLLRARGIRPMIARRGVVHGSALGRGTHLGLAAPVSAAADPVGTSR
jgi:IS5 family transposase